MPNATRAADFLAGLGVNTAMDYWDTTYVDVAKVTQALAYLGVTHVRDHIPATDAASQAPYKALAASGIRFDFLFPGGNLNLAANMQALDSFARAAPGAIAAVEGPNEVNLWPVSYNGKSGLSGAAAEQKAIYAAVHADKNLTGVPVYALSLGGGSSSQEKALGDLSAYADYGNAHVYPDAGEPPNPNWFAPWLASQSVPTGSDPMVLTEFGYATVPNNPALDGVTEAVQAKENLNVLFDAWKAGVKATYLYELLNSLPDAAQSNQEANYGLFNADGTPKLAATAIHNTTTILADPGTGGAPGSLNYSVANLPGTGNTLLLEKSSGVFDIVLWNEPVIWNGTTHKEIAASTTTVTVNLGASYGSVRLYDPLLGTAAVQSFANVSQVQLGLTDHPLFLEVSGSGTPTPTPTSTPTPTPSPGLTLTGTTGNDTLTGGAGNDVISGGRGNDIITGGVGNDTLTGGTGNDTFRYLTPSDGIDHITDFVPGSDHIGISQAGFSLGAGYVVGGPVSSAHFVAHAANSATSAVGVSQLIYNTATHALLWDADGSGAGAAVTLAVFDNGATPRASDLVVGT